MKNASFSRELLFIENINIFSVGFLEGKMTDPTSGFFSAKLAAMIGGLFGGAAILTFIQPKTIGEAFVRGGVSVGSAILFSSPILRALDMPDDWDFQALAGFALGFLSYSILGMVANFLVKHKDSTITDAADDLRGKKNAKRRP